MSRILMPWLLALALSIPTFVFAQEPAPLKTEKASSSAAIDINTPSAAQLTDLPGIGTKTAERIVEYREKNGPFRKIETS